MVNRSNGHNDWMFERDLSRSVAEILSRASDPINGDEFKSDYLRRHLLSKFAAPDQQSQLERRDRAIEKLLNQERINTETTLRLRFDTSKMSIGDTSVASLLMTAKRFIAQWLGDLNALDWLSRCEFSSGASTTRKRASAFLHKKHDLRSSASAQVMRMLRTQCYETAPFLYIIAQFQELEDKGFKPVIHDYNQLFTVPKNNEIDRCAAKEPDWNMFLQKGLGTLIRSKLLAIGIDLNDQSINNNLARIGSIDGSLATLDLSAASDSITEELVYQLLPTDWFDALSSVRSKVCQLPGRTHYHKWVLFSTMGNGFTFELESLIFYALMRAVAYHFGIKGKLSVYGDDIICPVEMALHLSSLFAVVGFKVNPEKSFWTGHFRESCGGHYYHGHNVTPIYIREPITDIPALINIINQFRIWSCQNSLKIGSSHNFQLWKQLTLLIPKELRRIVIGGNDPYQRSYVAALTPFKGGLYGISKTTLCRGDDLAAAYNSWSWQSAARSNLDLAWGVSEARSLFEFGSFSRFAKPVLSKGKFQYLLKTKAEVLAIEQADTPYTLTLIRDDGWEYRYNSENSKSVYTFSDELVS